MYIVSVRSNRAWDACIDQITVASLLDYVRSTPYFHLSTEYLLGKCGHGHDANLLGGR